MVKQATVILAWNSFTRKSTNINEILSLNHSEQILNTELN